MTLLAATALAASWISYGFAWPGTNWSFYSPYALYADSPCLRARAFFVAFLIVRCLIVLCSRLLRAEGHTRNSD